MLHRFLCLIGLHAMKMRYLGTTSGPGHYVMKCKHCEHSRYVGPS